ncbi:MULTISPECIES: MFS transporter [unclassified Paenibacillus]|uniref:MFS transporter n=1 Tax=unclassified Paenibacillus TaxID=185978 RepID=UPI001C108D90|nr:MULTISPECIES: MFS transporter [unclassified Paenibacillus]MBU5445521.1 MFS transporter [Paenibacillus sp. MSJ-34]CAH0118905.1 Putative nucleoside transporter YegT [Paenibacillus sp. CECT 9249]
MPTSVNSKRSFTVIKCFQFFMYGAIAIFGTYFPLYLQQAGMSKLQIGALLAGGPFISIIANPFWGFWSDKLHNIRRILILMLTANLLVMLVVFQVHAYSVIYAGMIVYFFFQSPLFSQTNSLVLNAIEGTGHRFGAFRLWGSLGWAVLALATGPVIAALGTGKLWIIYSAMMVVTIALAFGLPRGGSGKTNKFSLQGYRKVFVHKPFLLFVIIGILISVPNSINSTFVSIYIADMGGAEALIGWSAFLSSIFEIPVFLLLDRFLKRNVGVMVACLAAVSLLFALRWFFMSVASDPYQIIFIQILHCITFGGYYYIGTQLTAIFVPAEYRASGQAVYALTWGGLSGIVAGFAGGWLFQELGGPSVYLICTVMALLGIAGFALLYMFVRREDSGRRAHDAAL